MAQDEFIQDDFCSTRQSKKLMEKGFPQYDDSLETYYEKGNEIRYVIPTLYLAQKWLRNKKNISILPFINYRNDIGSSEENLKYCVEIIRLYPVKILLNFDDYKNPDMNFNTFEEALSAGIEKALELI